MKVVVIGAGIAGLVFALSCQRAGIDVKIYDKAKQLDNIGGGILLWPHGLRYLEDLGLLDCLQAVSMSVKGMNIVSHRGQTIYTEKHDIIYSLLNGEILPIDRSELQQRLIGLLNDDVLTLGKTCTAIEALPTYTGVHFSDGDVIHADLVVGADGVKSCVRAELNPTSVPLYSGFCWWGGIVDRCHVPHYPVDEVQFVLGQNKLCSIWPTQGGHFMWYLPVKMPLANYHPDRDRQIQVAEIAHGWHDDVVTIMTAPQSAKYFYLPIYEVPRADNIAFGRVVLIGDAACASGPLLGQGANKAIEDAYVLAKLISKNPENIALTLQKYNHMRLPRQRRFLELEHMSADSLMQDSYEDLLYFEEHIPNINLTMMYQDMIPLVNKTACDALILETLE